ncbi:putative transposase [Neokomagataea thailandica NBRC 106555]|nr:putative transposase [Neokomagataea thailandica NBRC 106555]
MLAERGVSVDHSRIYRRVQRYAPEMEKRLQWYWKRSGFSSNWRMDETYIKVKGQWAYLSRAVGKNDDTIDFLFSPTQNAKAAKRFSGKALNGLRGDKSPKTAYATIKDFEVMKTLKKGQAKLFQFQEAIMGEVRLIES